jgi:hypothetical protein
MCSFALHTLENETEPRKPGMSLVVVIEVEAGVGVGRKFNVLTDVGETADLTRGLA